MAESSLPNMIWSKFKDKFSTVIIAGMFAGGGAWYNHFEIEDVEANNKKDFENFENNAAKYMDKELETPTLLRKMFNSEFVKQFADGKVKEAIIRIE